MSKEELLAEIMRLPTDEQRGLVENVIDHWPDTVDDPDMTPELAAELDRRYADMLAHPERESSWEEVSARLLARKLPKI